MCGKATGHDFISRPEDTCCLPPETLLPVQSAFSTRDLTCIRQTNKINRVARVFDFSLIPCSPTPTNNIFHLKRVSTTTLQLIVYTGLFCVGRTIMVAPKSAPDLSYLTDTLPTLIPPIFEQVQHTTANHRKNLVALRKIHETCANVTEQTPKGTKLSGEKQFNAVFTDMVNRVLGAKKGVAVADRVVKYVAAYVAYCTEQGTSDPGLGCIREGGRCLLFTVDEGGMAGMILAGSPWGAG